MSRNIATDVAQATAATLAGVVVSYRESPDCRSYVIWAIGTSGRITQHELDADVTTPARLEAHVRGFIENHNAAWATAQAVHA